MKFGSFLPAEKNGEPEVMNKKQVKFITYTHTHTQNLRILAERGKAYDFLSF